VVGTWLACRAGQAASKGAVVQLTRSLAVELAGAALLLSDPQSAYVTGTVLPVDGGWTSH
jgi:NAD(P)-dependent dehydrogenase (short-subunit alcohol dehydrogenase family)